MKNLLLLVSVCVLCTTAASAQILQNANWCFGTGLGFSFVPNANSPTMFTSALPSPAEALATLSRPNGELWFYADGVTVYNKNHAVMTNGAGLLGHRSNTQGSLIVPRPGYPTRFYLVTIDGKTGYKQGLYYSEVDVTTGLGQVIPSVKNVVMQDHNRINIDTNYNNYSEKLTSTRHANGVDYWVVAVIGDHVYSYKVTSSGISIYPNAFTPAVIDVDVPSNSTEGIGQMKVSPNGERIAIAYKTEGIAMGDFDNATGLVNFDPDLIIMDSDEDYYGLEFSPLSQYIYFENDHIVYRGNSYTATATTVTPVASIPSTVVYGGGFQSAINGRIYIANYSALVPNMSELSVINDPDNLTNPDLQGNSIDFSPGVIFIGLPQWVQFHELCAQNVTLSTPESSIIPYTYSYSDYIMTNLSYAVNPGQEITMKAGNYILLDSNTHITEGSIFEAYIENCNSGGDFSEPAPRMNMHPDSAQAEATKLFLYPNPAGTYVNITLTNATLKHLTVTSVKGIRLFDGEMNNPEYLLDTSGYAKGIYIVNAQSVTGQTFTEKLVIK